MIIRDLDCVRITLTPLEANAILIVDTNAVLAFAIALQPFQTIPRRRSEISEVCRSMEHLQFLQPRPVDAAAALFLPEPLGFGIRNVLITRCHTIASQYYCQATLWRRGCSYVQQQQ